MKRVEGWKPHLYITGMDPSLSIEEFRDNITLFRHGSLSSEMACPREYSGRGFLLYTIGLGCCVHGNFPGNTLRFLHTLPRKE